jgi:hypothetical protein
MEKKVKGRTKNGQKKMSKIEKSKKVLKKHRFSALCDQNALINKKIILFL